MYMASPVVTGDGLPRIFASELTELTVEEIHLARSICAPDKLRDSIEQSDFFWGLRDTIARCKQSLSENGSDCGQTETRAQQCHSAAGHSRLRTERVPNEKLAAGQQGGASRQYPATNSYQFSVRDQNRYWCPGLPLAS
ncbi:hypothetical protein TM49_09475 [Martelella endophytica]|uniref:Uncharacterized protein n=1 Tax=Martelella endophytica TaxID=1486262 RepID=A0A0D5LP12_MAREN|nr:hypothetical protein TM49_09475 [Martelella endophytica]